MEVYESFARVYDELMDEVPYEEWADFIRQKLGEYAIREGLMLELGCGTGKMMELMGDAGFDMIGVDSSVEMLQIAQEKSQEGNKDFLYLWQDMREFELYGTVRAVISICDSINYITNPEELTQVFRLVNNYLDPGGFFIFDLNTVYKYRELLGDTTIAENREEGSFIWENSYFEEDQINEYDLTLFIRQEDGRFRKYEETHYQRAYELETVKNLLEKSGLKLEAVYDAFTFEEPAAKSERVYFVAREKEKLFLDKQVFCLYN